MADDDRTRELDISAWLPGQRAAAEEDETVVDEAGSRPTAPTSPAPTSPAPVSPSSPTSPASPTSPVSPASLASPTAATSWLDSDRTLLLPVVDGGGLPVEPAEPQHRHAEPQHRHAVPQHPRADAHQHRTDAERPAGAPSPPEAAGVAAPTPPPPVSVAMPPATPASAAAPPRIPKPVHGDRLPSDERNMLIFVTALLALGTLAIVAMASIGR